MRKPAPKARTRGNAGTQVGSEGVKARPRETQSHFSFKGELIVLGPTLAAER